MLKDTVLICVALAICFMIEGATVNPVFEWPSLIGFLATMWVVFNFDYLKTHAKALIWGRKASRNEKKHTE